MKNLSHRPYLTFVLTLSVFLTGFGKSYQMLAAQEQSEIGLIYLLDQIKEETGVNFVYEAKLLSEVRVDIDYLNHNLDGIEKLDFILQKVGSKKPKKRDRKTEKTIREFNSTIRELKFQYGVVSSKFNHNSSGDWESVLQGTAQQLK